MFHTKALLKTLLVACVLVTVAVAAPVSNDQPVVNSGDVIRTTLQPDLTLKSSLSLDLFPTAAFHQKTCRCSCGFICNQDDDCGPGGKCDQFISCCDRESTSQAFRQIAARSTHAGEAPAVAVNVKCK